VTHSPASDPVSLCRVAVASRRLASCSMTTRQPPDPAGEWLTVDQSAYLQRARIRPGTVRGVSASKGRYGAQERYARSVDGYVPGLDEVDRLHELGWNDTTIAQALGIHLSNVAGAG
jgi:hypothetical protein